MSKKNDYTKYIGRTFGYLTVNSLFKGDKKQTNGNIMAHCICKCTRECDRAIAVLVRQGSKQQTCGICNKGISYETYIGKRYGFATIKGVRYGKEKVEAEFLCDCGETFYRFFTNVNDKRTNSKTNMTCGNCFKGKAFSYYIGKKYGNLEVIEIKRKKGNTIAICKCICNRVVERSLSLLERDCAKTPYCGECYNGIQYKDYIGKTFGVFTIKKIESKKNNRRSGKYAYCKCICGNETWRYFPQLINKSKNITCGECYNGIPYKDYIGKTFGSITIKSFKKLKEKNLKDGSTLVEVYGECICKRKITTTLNCLVKGNITTCGECYRGIQYKDYIGKTFGYLTVKSILKPKTEDNNSNHYHVLVKCKCNNSDYLNLSLFSLFKKSYKKYSCGCLNKNLKYLKKISFGKLYIKNISSNNIDGLRYICKCTCGNETEVLESELFTGKVTCCEECSQNMNDNNSNKFI